MPNNQGDLPIRAYRLTLQLDADSLDDLSNALRDIIDKADRGELAKGLSGGCRSGYIYELLHDPQQTHEAYFAELRAHLTQQNTKTDIDNAQ